MSVSDASVYASCRGGGIIHVGASIGQESAEYAAYNLDVIWFEPQPEAFSNLQSTISHRPKQKAYNYAVLDEDDKEYPFHVVDFRDSSSLLELGSMFNEVFKQKEVGIIQVRGITLNTFFKRYNIDPSGYQILHIDTQGVELPVLKGATEILSHIKFIDVEIADFEVYKGCSKLSDFGLFLTGYGFKERKKEVLNTKHPSAAYGNIFQVMYER